MVTLRKAAKAIVKTVFQKQNEEFNDKIAERMRAQLEVSQPGCKQLWAKLIRMKIANQARMVDLIGLDSEPLWYLTKKVRSGDSDNVEARAARLYWPILFGKMGVISEDERIQREFRA